MRLCHALTYHHASRSRYPGSCHVADGFGDTSHPVHIEDWWDNRNPRNTPTSIRTPDTTQTAAFTTSVPQQPTSTPRCVFALTMQPSRACVSRNQRARVISLPGPLPHGTRYVRLTVCRHMPSFLRRSSLSSQDAWLDRRRPMLRRQPTPHQLLSAGASGRFLPTYSHENTCTVASFPPMSSIDSEHWRVHHKSADTERKTLNTSSSTAHWNRIRSHVYGLSDGVTTSL